MQPLQEIGTQHSYAMPVPPGSNPQNISRPPIIGQQSLPRMHSHLLPTQPIDHSQMISSCPPMTTTSVSQTFPRLHAPQGQPFADHQTQITNSLNTNLPQPGIASYNPTPLLPNQNVSSPTGPGLPQYEARQFAPPLPIGQPIMSPPGPGFPQVRQKQYPQTGTAMPGQTMANPMGPVPPQPGQKQYSSAPPLPGQALSNPLGTNRTPLGTIPDYQQSTMYPLPTCQNPMVQLYKLFLCIN